jgi:hypothetical protein
VFSSTCSLCMDSREVGWMLHVNLRPPKPLSINIATETRVLERGNLFNMVIFDGYDYDYNLTLLTKPDLIPVNSPEYPPRPSPPEYTDFIDLSFFCFSAYLFRFFTLGFLTSFLRLGARPLFFSIWLPGRVSKVDFPTQVRSGW